MVEQEAVNFEVVSSSLTGGATMKIQTLKVCFLYSPRLGENVVRPYNETSV